MQSVVHVYIPHKARVDHHGWVLHILNCPAVYISSAAGGLDIHTHTQTHTLLPDHDARFGTARLIWFTRGSPGLLFRITPRSLLPTYR